MPTLTLQAHYAGQRIVLDEPYDLPANFPLPVTLLPAAADSDSEAASLRAAASSDAFAFLADLAEDFYTLADGEPLRDAVQSHSGSVSVRRPDWQQGQTNHSPQVTDDEHS
ncbi:MAG: hypothetical protein HYY24_09080 [Verrucomicrobia bacterium]|nr:hypothetical protein [Verrucomicrobiota bacterium]